MHWKLFIAGMVAAATAFGTGFMLSYRSAQAEQRRAAAAPVPPSPAPDFPGGRPIDAAQISTGRIAVERMPSEVTTALEVHSNEIAKTAEIIETKQARISGTCAPGSAIRLVRADGTVVCERIPRGVISVSALSGVARRSTTKTTQGAINGAVGRYETEGEEDFLVVPLQLPDGAVVTGFSYTAYDDSPKIDTAAYLYRSDDVPLAVLSTDGAAQSPRSFSTEDIQNPHIDNRNHAYFVYMRISAGAFSDIMPIGASISYRLP